MRVEVVDFISVPTRDYDRAVAWYRDVLGLPVSAYDHAEVETPNVTLSFWLPEEQGEPFVPNENGIALRVADVHAAVEEVRAAGGEVLGIEDSGVCHMGFVKDPDGNVVILHRRYAPRSKGRRAHRRLPRRARQSVRRAGGGARPHA
jgi:catechol 2,3-dioxygenase-like lactoylglutathione lyase family enzyme